MSDFSSNIILVIAVTSIATYLSRSLGVLFSERIDENSKIFRCLNYWLHTLSICCLWCVLWNIFL